MFTHMWQFPSLVWHMMTEPSVDASLSTWMLVHPTSTSSHPLYWGFSCVDAEKRILTTDRVRATEREIEPLNFLVFQKIFLVHTFGFLIHTSYH